ncbi:MAG: phosphoribosylamine--glycine ligase [Cyclobacteriaceae bacterium]|nr:phosphoribosylamine--glycine ligase [Cyclobacteriaceae bacterium]
MNILLLGSGGREHTLAWKMVRSTLCSKLFVAPGNAGTHGIATNVPVSVNDFEGLAEVIKKENIEMVIVGPEDPLVNGFTDFVSSDPSLRHVRVIGPGKEGARLEGSKDYSKAFMERHNIPTAAYKTFTASEIEEGIKYLETLSPPYVLKADGLAAGKGVIISSFLNEAKGQLKEMLLESKFGKAGNRVVIEEYLNGIELSVFVLTDGENYLVLPEAKDYKRIGDGDTGLNTGGMGAVSPVPFATKEFMRKVEERVIKPTISGLKQEGIEYKGFIFIGLMNNQGEPSVVEYNVRMGDPETQAVIPRVENDLVELFLAVSEQRLDKVALKVTDQTAVTVVGVAGGYPGDYEKGDTIEGIENIAGSELFHAGTGLKEGKVITNGGRILAVTSLRNNLMDAITASYQGIKKIHWKNCYFRKDIGQDLLHYKP